MDFSCKVNFEKVLLEKKSWLDKKILVGKKFGWGPIVWGTKVRGRKFQGRKFSPFS
jgi:hypothetical protein